jgi:hypothetical protein
MPANRSSDAHHGEVRTNESGQEEVYIGGLGWSLTDLALVRVDMVCSGVLGCGRAFQSAETYPKSVVSEYKETGQPYPMPHICPTCDESLDSREEEV